MKILVLSNKDIEEMYRVWIKTEQLNFDVVKGVNCRWCICYRENECKKEIYDILKDGLKMKKDCIRNNITFCNKYVNN